MAFLEMARNPAHGGRGWAFTDCVWSPTRKRDGREWPFWKKILDIEEGDIVLHLRGVPPNAAFVGYSVASGDGYKSDQRPPDPGEWNFAESFFRADLSGFSPFAAPVLLKDVFESHRETLEDYFHRNQQKGRKRLNLFYVLQAGRIQCLNGAYLSDLDEELFGVLFGDVLDSPKKTHPASDTHVPTDTQLAYVNRRIGQQRFSEQIKQLYKFKCCFPGCEVDHPRFLIGAHIARWSDNQALRGDLSNGLCLCLMHDKAFECGAFTLDDESCVFVNPDFKPTDSRFIREISQAHGKAIRLFDIRPNPDALLEHWERVGIDPIG